MYIAMYMSVLHACTCVYVRLVCVCVKFPFSSTLHGAMPVQGVFMYTAHVQGGVVFKCGLLDALYALCI